jgi:hypothetical protein
MSRQANTNGGETGPADRFVVVRVEDANEPTLAGHPGGSYQSPPQSHEQGMALVRLLLGGAIDPECNRQWTAPIPGGRRVVTLTEDQDR